KTRKKRWKRNDPDAVATKGLGPVILKVPIPFLHAALRLRLKLLQRQLDRFAEAGTAGHRLRELHIGYAGGKIRETDRRPGADGLDELCFHAPVPGFLGRNGDLFKLIGPAAHSPLPIARAADAVGGKVVVKHPQSPIKRNASSLAVRR